MTYKPARQPPDEFQAYVRTELLAIASEFAALEKRIAALEEPLPPVAPGADVLWRWNATAIAPFGVQAKDPSRVTLVQAGGRNAVRLLTMHGDNNVNGSGAMERCDLRLGNELTDAVEGKEHWWSHVVRFPDDYMELPRSEQGGSWNTGLVMCFHNTADQGGQANAQLQAMPATAISPDRPIGLHFQVSGGDPANPKVGQYPIGPIVRNRWLAFEYRMRWSAGSGGFIDGWLDGVQFMAHKGPTLYTGQGAYLKLANYRTAHGKPSAVLHGPVIRARSQAALL